MSLRTTIALALLGMLFVVGVMAGGLAYWVASSEAGQFMDDQMRQIASMVDERTRPAGIGGLQEPEDRFAVTVWTKDGRRVVLTEPGEALEPTTLGFSQVSRAGEAWRTLAMRSDGRTVVVAQRLSARREIAAHTAIEVALPVLASAPLAWLIVAATVHLLLRPMIALGRRIEDRDVTSGELSTAGLPKEILPFVTAINGLVGRLQAALDQQRRFVADSAHQLRTPLAALRLQIDNLHGSSLPDTSTEPLRAGMRRIGLLLNQLLDLAKFDAREPAGDIEIVDLAAVLTQCVADRIALADDGGVDLGLGSIAPVSAPIIRADLVRLLDNVIDNAVRYTPAGGRVDCSLFAGDTVSFVVEDTGPGVPPCDLPRLTERFFRGANGDVVGSGLGLAIAQAAADRNGLTLTIANRQDRTGLFVRIAMPCRMTVRPASIIARAP